MKKTIGYQTSYSADHYALTEKGTPIGKLFKSSWMGGRVESRYQDRRFQFIREGVFHPVITIIDKAQNGEIGKVKVAPPFFRFVQKATLSLSNGKQYNWMHTSVFHSRWRWDNGEETVAASREPSLLSDREGEVHLSTSDEDEEAELLTLLGLHLRSVFGRQSLVNLYLALLVLLLNLRWFFA